MNEREKCPTCGTSYKHYFDYGKGCSAIGKHDPWHDAPQPAAPTPTINTPIVVMKSVTPNDSKPPLHYHVEPPLEPGEFFMTRGDGVQERCRYVGQSVTIPWSVASSEPPEKRDPAVESADELAKAAFALGKLRGKYEASEELGRDVIDRDDALLIADECPAEDCRCYERIKTFKAVRGEGPGDERAALLKTIVSQAREIAILRSELESEQEHISRLCAELRDAEARAKT